MLRSPAYFTVSVTPTVFETVPPVPFTVMVKVPVVALLLTVNFSVEDPVPPEIEEGLKLADVPLLCPEADNVMEEMLPWLTAVEMVVVPEDPLETVSVVGFAPMLKIRGSAVTVRLTVVV